MPVRFREAAIQDLEALYDYIAGQGSPAVGWSFVERIRAHCKKLASFPERGRSAGDISPGLRFLIFEGRVTIAYRVDDAGVRIVRIIYAGRDYRNEMFPD